MRIITALLCVLFLYSCNNVTGDLSEMSNFIMVASSQPSYGGSVTPGTGEFEPNSEVELTAVPEDGYRFEHWEGDLSGSENPAILKMEADRNVTAIFSPLESGSSDGDDEDSSGENGEDDNGDTGDNGEEEDTDEGDENGSDENGESDNGDTGDTGEEDEADEGDENGNGENGENGDEGDTGGEEDTDERDENGSDENGDGTEDQDSGDSEDSEEGDSHEDESSDGDAGDSGGDEEADEEESSGEHDGDQGEFINISIIEVSGPSYAEKGEKVTVFVTVKNLGTLNIRDDIDVELINQTEDKDIDEQEIKYGIDAGGSAVLTFIWDTRKVKSSGVHTLVARHDYDDDKNEGALWLSTQIEIRDK